MVTESLKNYIESGILPMYDGFPSQRAQSEKLASLLCRVHSRHRSFDNFLMNVISVIAAYCFFDKKPAINMDL